MDSETQDLIPTSPATGADADPSPAKPRQWLISSPIHWLSMLCAELNPTFVLGVVLVYGLSQGFAGSFFRVVTDYYWKDVQRINPSAVQIYSGLYYIPWVMKPVWGVLTDVFPVFGYRRRPYFVGAGVLGVCAAVTVAVGGGLPVAAALGCLVGMTAAVAIADVTIDACIARNSIERPELAADMQSLCGFVSSVGALLGFSTSGLFVHMLGAQEFVGMIYAIGALASIVGILIYHKFLKEYSFRSLLFYAQLLYATSGMLDLFFVLRWNLKLDIPDYIFVILEECVSRVVSRIRWMPMMILSTKLCPLGIEGTFFALLMCIDSLGSLSSKLGGGVVLHVFHVTRTDFKNLPWVVLLRNLLRFSTLGLIFLLPKENQSEAVLPHDMLKSSDGEEEDGIQLVTLIGEEHKP